MAQTDSPPPPFLQTCSEVGEARESSVPKEINLPKEARKSCFFMILKYIYTIYICTNLLPDLATGGSVEQPLQVPGGKARNQPKPHPSGKIV